MPLVACPNAAMDDARKRVTKRIKVIVAGKDRKHRIIYARN